MNKELNKKSKDNMPGFTLSEVLIVISLLGVVAVLTIPAFTNTSSQRITIANAQKAEYDINQLALRLQAECPRLRCGNVDARVTNLLSNMNKSTKDVNIEWHNDKNQRQMTVKLNGSTSADLEYTFNTNGSVTPTEASKYTKGGCSTSKPCASNAKGYICYKFSEGCD